MPSRIGVLHFLLSGLLTMAACGAVLAQSATPPGAKAPVAAPALIVGDLSWGSLSSAQRTALAPLQGEWARIDPVRRQKWVEIADRFPSMTPEERQRVQTRMSQWARMSPKERGEARLHFQELRQLSPDERQARWERYQALPPEQRAQFSQRATPPGSAPAPGTRPSQGPSPKSNIVGTAPGTSIKPVAPTVVQAGPGATTTLITQQPAPPLHQQPGLPKVTATPGFVDKTTLLPRRGAQAAGVRAASSAGPAPAARPASPPAPPAALAPGPASAPVAPAPAQ